MADLQSKTGYTEADMSKWQKEAADFDRVAAETADMAAVREKLRQRTTGTPIADALRQVEQGRVAKQAMKAAYAQGYNPAAQRMAMESMADRQHDVASKVNAIAQEEQNRASVAYGQFLQQRQKMSMAAEEAKKAYVMGNEKIALQALDSARRAEVSAKGMQMMEAQAKADASMRMTNALISATATGVSYGAQQGWFNAAPTAPVSPVSSLSPQAQSGVSRAVPSLYESGGLFDSGTPQQAYAGPMTQPVMLTMK